MQGAVLGVQAQVGNADLGHEAVGDAAQRPGFEPDIVPDHERPGQQQHQAREYVGQGLLPGDAEQDRGDRPADEELPDRDLHQPHAQDQHGQPADEEYGVPDHRGVRRANGGVSTSLVFPASPSTATAPKTKNAAMHAAATIL